MNPSFDAAGRRIDQGRLQMDEVTDAFRQLAREQQHSSALCEVVAESDCAGKSFERRIHRSLFSLQIGKNVKALIMSIPWDGARVPERPAEVVAQRVLDHLRTTLPGERIDEYEYPLDPAIFRSLMPRHLIDDPK